MRKLKFTNFLLIVSLALAPFASLARTKAIEPAHGRLSATPIGSVASLEAVEINGNPAGRQELVWNGDVLQAATGATAQVLLADIGSLTLRSGAKVKLATDLTEHTLSAVVLQGELNVVLKAESAAKLELAGANFISTKGAQFRATVRDGQPLVRAQAGQVVSLGNFALRDAKDVAAQQVGPRKYLIKPLNLGTNTEIRARSTRNLQVRVTDENDRPVPDAPVLFLLGSGGGTGGSSSAGTIAGQATMRATTNSQGVAEVNFTASNNVGSNTRIRVQVEGSDAVWEGTLNVISAQAGFWAPQNAVPIFTVIGVGAGLGAWRYATRDPARPTPQVDTRQGGTVVLP